MAKKEWTVRVIVLADPINPQDILTGMWVEQLRYAYGVRVLAELENPQRLVIEFPAPARVDSHIWARQNAQRMRSFGIDAAEAPKWEGPEVTGEHARTVDNLLILHQTPMHQR